MHISFRSQGGIGVAKQMGFGEDFSLKVVRSDVGDGERWSTDSEAQLKHAFLKIFEDIDFLQDVDHSCFHH